jgi:hypothetical protein
MVIHNFRNFTLLLFVFSSLFTLAQQPATNNVKKNVQLYVDQNTNISDYDKINYSELADKKYRLRNSDSKDEPKRSDLEANKELPADVKVANLKIDKNEKAQVHVTPDNSNSIELKVDNFSQTEINKTNTFDAVIEKGLEVKNEIKSDQDFKILSEEKDTTTFNNENIAASQPKSDLVVDSTSKSSVLNTSLSNTNKSITNTEDKVVPVKVTYKSPTAVEKVFVKETKTYKQVAKQPVKPAADIKPSIEPKEIIEPNQHESIVKNKSVFNENWMLEELIHSGKYEVTDDGKYIRIGKKK